MPKSEAQKRANAKWDKAHLKKASCALNMEQYALFKMCAERRGKTVSGLVKSLVMACIAEDVAADGRDEQS